MNQNQLSLQLRSYHVQVDLTEGSFAIDTESGGSTQVLLAGSDTGSGYASAFRVSIDQNLLDFSTAASSIRVFSPTDACIIVYTFPGIGTFSITFSADSSGSLGIRTVFHNQGSAEVQVQVLFDTILGESSGSHFVIGENEISREASFSTADTGFSPVSSSIFSGRAGERGLFVTALSHPVNSPGTVVAVANLRRLTETVGSFSVNPNRNFNLLPFSVNDSAILGSTRVSAGQTGAIAFLLSYTDQSSDIQTAFVFPDTPVSGGIEHQTSNSFALSVPSTSTNQSQHSSSTPETSSHAAEASEEYILLQRLNALLELIDTYIENGSVTDEELNLVKDTFDTLRRSAGL